MSAAKKTTKRGAGTAVLSAKAMTHQADRTVWEIGKTLQSVRDLGAHMKDSPYEGWTMQECLATITAKVRVLATSIPTPTETKTAATVCSLLREGRAALDGLDDAAELLGVGDFDGGMAKGTGAVALGAAVETLARRAGTAFESIAWLMGGKCTTFFFYAPENSGQTIEESKEAA